MLKHLHHRTRHALAGLLVASVFGLAPQAVLAVDFDAAKIAKDEALAARVPTEIRARGKISIGSDTSYPPAEFLGGADGRTPMGIDVDLAAGIAAKLGLEFEFVTAEFASILPAIGPRYDLGISAFTITNERYGAVDFVSYFNGGRQWAVQMGNPANFDPEDPCGSLVGVQTGSNPEKP
ncbi:transporter substrate-binding domain-containing protein [Arenibacterium sp. LLYu02]|uniref:transporter substrate-binding domain-containing protein n=1 Tax=Arenibacterium sp. LLYu02 TaxID=3404132 RepID=UPI003B21568F